MTREEFVEKLTQLKAFKRNELQDYNITRENAEAIADIIEENQYQDMYDSCLRVREGK